jgi:hypothetical protein
MLIRRKSRIFIVIYCSDFYPGCLKIHFAREFTRELIREFVREFTREEDSTKKAVQFTISPDA